MLSECASAPSNLASPRPSLDVQISSSSIASPSTASRSRSFYAPTDSLLPSTNNSAGALAVAAISAIASSTRVHTNEAADHSVSLSPVRHSFSYTRRGDSIDETSEPSDSSDFEDQLSSASSAAAGPGQRHHYPHHYPRQHQHPSHHHHRHHHYSSHPHHSSSDRPHKKHRHRQQTDIERPVSPLSMMPADGGIDTPTPTTASAIPTARSTVEPLHDDDGENTSGSNMMKVLSNTGSVLHPPPEHAERLRSSLSTSDARKRSGDSNLPLAERKLRSPGCCTIC